ncbi:MAG: response regulator [Candidatus Heimdallarchaeota archaeon]|nr:response regulator [Candidatus Heimdallarchaeota archaeon]
MFEKIKILYIEDNEDDMVLMNHSLKDICQNIYHQRVDNKYDLAYLLESEKWDIIIIDNSLPQMTSLDAIEIIKERNIDAPMICVSGSDFFELKEKCIDAGAQAFILKENLKEINETIVKIIQQCFD